MNQFDIELCKHTFCFAMQDDQNYTIFTEHNEVKYEGRSFLKPIGSNGPVVVKRMLMMLAEGSPNIEEKCTVEFVSSNLMLTIPVPFVGKKILVTLAKENISADEETMRAVRKLEKQIALLTAENKWLHARVAAQDKFRSITCGFRNGLFFIDFTHAEDRILLDALYRVKFTNPAFEQRKNIFDAINESKEGVALGSVPLHGGNWTAHNFRELFVLHKCFFYDECYVLSPKYDLSVEGARHINKLMTEASDQRHQVGFHTKIGLFNRCSAGIAAYPATHNINYPNNSIKCTICINEQPPANCTILQIVYKRIPRHHIAAANDDGMIKLVEENRKLNAFGVTKCVRSASSYINVDTLKMTNPRKSMTYYYLA
jgi:uncharacterized small protein (DUF1192 family)